MVLSYSLSDPIKLMSMDQVLCYLLIPLATIFADVLFVATDVGGCWWPISAGAVLMAIDFCKFSNNPPNYASVADAIKFRIMLHYTCTGTFLGGIDFIGVSDFVPKKKYPPALLCASVSEI